MLHRRVYKNTRAEELLQEAEHIDAIARRLSTNLQGSMVGLSFYHPVGDEEAIEEAERILGRSWKREKHEDIPGPSLDFMDFDTFVKDVLIKANQKRIEALGAKLYPMEVCKVCQNITGWLGPRTWCEICEDEFLVHTNSYRLPEIMMGSARYIEETRRSILDKGRQFPQLVTPSIDERKVSVSARLYSLLGKAERRTTEQGYLWRDIVCHPDTNENPEMFTGAVCDVPVKYMQDSSTCGEEPLVHFGAIPYEWAGKNWKRRDDLRHRPLPHQFPTTFSQNIGAQALNEAWYDFKLLVHSVNMQMWDDPRLTLRGDSVIVSATPGESNTRTIGNKRYTAQVSSDGRNASFTIE